MRASRRWVLQAERILLPARPTFTSERSLNCHDNISGLSTTTCHSTDKSQEAIKALNPLCTLRYSATHRNPYNLVYRLDPVRAFELRLVKQIVVASATSKGELMMHSFVFSTEMDMK